MYVDKDSSRRVRGIFEAAWILLAMSVYQTPGLQTGQLRHDTIVLH